MSSMFSTGRLTPTLKSCVKRLKTSHHTHSALEQFVEWGINLSMLKRVKLMLPKGILGRLTILNIIVIALAIALSGWTIYNTACFLVEGMGHIDEQRQRQFNATLFQYLLIFS